MGVVVFKMSDVDRVVAQLAVATNLTVDSDDLFNADMHKGGVILNKDGLTEKQVKAKGGAFWPSGINIIPEKIIRRLQIVGDHGVYLMGNVYTPKDAATEDKPVLAYANGCDPNVDEKFYENKERLTGGSDVVIKVPMEWYEHAKANNFDFLRIQINKRTVKLLT